MDVWIDGWIVARKGGRLDVMEGREGRGRLNE